MVECPRRGEIYWAYLDPALGSEMGKTRPVIVVQNEIGNRLSPITVVVPVTSKIPDRVHPFQVRLPEATLPKASVALCNHLRAVDRRRLKPGPVAMLDAETMAAVDDALRAELGLL
jgi:mRNA interferase MazF